MKAWKTYEIQDNRGTIVFANTAGEAKVKAIQTETLSDTQFVDIRVRRFKEADCLWNGHDEIDWYDNDTRLKLVRDFLWSCVEPSAECDSCVAKEWCVINMKERDNK